ncbi:hypothetical protein [Limnoglobus roseus]|uniref:Carboxypeptidase regulatory-like domain-containing protein n=1 Tax=Limnoglobus roseus TaxID=2598579 RepID=A0A5C1ALD6_9BACT|nr:hypothetical protein [Limnoglobus roseus]QEL19760.1 carboxypeptidase regulatory-like domain-containing protein [Limnoglobus roseus]
MSRTVFTTVLTLAFVAGCSSKPQLASIDGKVTLDGKPAGGVIVGFWPADPGAKLGTNNYGRVVTNAAGEFTLVADAVSGFTAGDYRISFSRILDAKDTPQPDAKPGEGGARETLSAAYLDPSTSNTSATVRLPATSLTFELKTAGMPPPPSLSKASYK